MRDVVTTLNEILKKECLNSDTRPLFTSCNMQWWCKTTEVYNRITIIFFLARILMGNAKYFVHTRRPFVGIKRWFLNHNCGGNKLILCVFYCNYYFSLLAILGKLLPLQNNYIYISSRISSNSFYHHRRIYNVGLSEGFTRNDR